MEMILRFGKKKQKFEELSQNPEMKEKSTAFGVKGIVMSIVAVLCAAASAFLLSLAFNDNIVMVVIGFLFGIVFGLGALLILVYAIMDIRYQFKLNKHMIRWFALATLILAAILCAVVYFLILTNVKW